MTGTVFLELRDLGSTASAFLMLFPLVIFLVEIMVSGFFTLGLRSPVTLSVLKWNPAKV